VIDDLSPSVVAALLALPASDDPRQPYVFRNRAGGPNGPHNLRHTFNRLPPPGHSAGDVARTTQAMRDAMLDLYHRGPP
jgi:integrase